jgi:hypothetical protein
MWMRYRVQPDGTLTEPTLLYDATADTRPGEGRATSTHLVEQDAERKEIRAGIDLSAERPLG